MPATANVQDTSRQHQLSDLFYAELLHTLGAYQGASEKLKLVLRSLSGRVEDKPLLAAVEQAKEHNLILRDRLHDPESPGSRRHPSPPNAEGKPEPDLLLPVRAFYATAHRALHWYLEAARDERDPVTMGEDLGARLARIHDPQRRGTEKPSEPLARGRLERTWYRLEEVKKLQELEKKWERLREEGLSGKEGKRTETDRAQSRGLTYSPGSALSFKSILNDHLAVGEHDEHRDIPQPLHLTILNALSDAHRWMHRAEHLRSQAFEGMFKEIPEVHAEMQLLLERSVVLNTFVYVAARSVPWVFAENDEERARVVDNFDECCENLTPTYCMWIGNQVGLLALERRAYTQWTLGRHDLAYCDFYKLIRLLRGLRRQVDRRAMRVPGTKTLVEGLTGTAEHHIGRIYRGQHAHRVALRYFDRAAKHLEGWEDHAEIGSILKNSRWRVDLLINRGKANFELGRIKASLLYYAQAWQAFLQLAASESHSTANPEVVKKVVEWLEAVKDEPELSKAELSERLEPLVGQFETVYSPVHLRLLAAEIMMRLGHLLYMLKLPPLGWTLPQDRAKLPPKADHKLSRRCMFQAAALDPSSTLIATDLLKIRHGSGAVGADAEQGEGGSGQRQPKSEGESEPDRPDSAATKDEYPTMASLREQWPAGESRFEEAVRVIEYVIQTWLADLDPESAVDEEGDRTQREIARELLRSFLAHTDSSNVKLAQLYQYLMQKPREVEGGADRSGATIDVVCLRRYSSFFPFLPRPAAFRALGGGYLAQVRDAECEEPFGIAIDPGPNFLDNLYRCGYALADIHMIVLTHDHADHIASVDALLALMGYRGLLEEKKTFSAEKRLTIVGNESVVRRYSFFNDPHPLKTTKPEGQPGDPSPEPVAADRRDAVHVMSFDEFRNIGRWRDKDRRRKAIERHGILLRPNSLRIEPVQTVDHLDAMGYVSQGFVLKMGEGAGQSSVLFTSDTGEPVKDEEAKSRYDGGPHRAGENRYKTLENATAEADVVVAHLSSVPLPELRKIAALTPEPPKGEGSTKALIELWGKAAEQARRDDEDFSDGIAETGFLLRQLQFAFRSRAKDDADIGVSPLSPLDEMKNQPERHLYLTGLLSLAKHMVGAGRRKRHPLLLIGELREELGTFRTRIASHITGSVFQDGEAGTALTADIGLRVRVSRKGIEKGERAEISVLCTTCDLDNDLIASERFHAPSEIREVCVKGENEGVFYNCPLHDPGSRPELLFVESVERYAVFGD
jgi:tetratricopeptide (TPR) repeat protein